jgi:hypothetical protein
MSTADDHVHFAAIGDYGEDDEGARSVGNLVKSWQPEFIVTLGDNNYPSGGADTIDRHIGQYYHEYIYPYMGAYTSTAPIVPENRFWPALGDHDWSSMSCTGANCTGPYLDYFTLPGNERYYDLVRGPVHFFILDSDTREPDGITRTSAQAAWLQAGLAASQTRWQVVIIHHVPYGSGLFNGPAQRIQWPFQAWGADAVMNGDDHSYERAVADGIPYFTNGLGGQNKREFGVPRPCSEVRYNAEFGAMSVEATTMTMTFQFINAAHEVIDTYSLPAPATHQHCTSTYVLEGADDAEQSVITGTVDLDGFDLELTTDLVKNREQVVGIRFQKVEIPRGATILAAMLEFYNAKDRDQPTSLVIHGVAADHSAAFVKEKFAISALPKTVAAVHWENVPPWLNRNYAEPSPDISVILQEIVNRPGWQSGNAISFVISGSGIRTTYSMEGDPERRPGLVFKYGQPGTGGQRLLVPIVMR